jgi:hypothetical protein
VYAHLPCQVAAVDCSPALKPADNAVLRRTGCDLVEDPEEPEERPGMAGACTHPVTVEAVVCAAMPAADVALGTDADMVVVVDTPPAHQAKAAQAVVGGSAAGLGSTQLAYQDAVHTEAHHYSRRVLAGDAVPDLLDLRLEHADSLQKLDAGADLAAEVRCAVGEATVLVEAAGSGMVQRCRTVVETAGIERVVVRDSAGAMLLQVVAESL